MIKYIKRFLNCNKVIVIMNENNDKTRKINSILECAIHDALYMIPNMPYPYKDEVQVILEKALCDIRKVR